MVEKFATWLVGIFEDDPLPYEIKYLIFALVKKNNYAYVCVGGNERVEKIVFNFEYFPLEAQFFDLETNENFSLFDLRKLIENILKLSYVKTALNGKEIFYGIWGEKDFYHIEKY